MKYLILTLLLFLGCSDTVEKKTTGVVVTEFGNEIEIIEIDGCEYLYLRIDRGAAISHKGNCKNPIHNGQ